MATGDWIFLVVLGTLMAAVATAFVRKKKRVALAFLVAPLVPTVALVHDAGPGIALVYSYVLSYFFGIPVHFILKEQKKESHVLYMTCGAITAPLVVVAISLLEYLASGMSQRPFLFFALLLAAVGGLEGLCFSLIRGKNERTA